MFLTNQVNVLPNTHSRLIETKASITRRRRHQQIPFLPIRVRSDKSVMWIAELQLRYGQRDLDVFFVRSPTVVREGIWHQQECHKQRCRSPNGYRYFLSHCHIHVA
jgi:hypothetical protein